MSLHLETPVARSRLAPKKLVRIRNNIQPQPDALPNASPRFRKESGNQEATLPALETILDDLSVNYLGLKHSLRKNDGVDTSSSGYSGVAATREPLPNAYDLGSTELGLVRSRFAQLGPRKDYGAFGIQTRPSPSTLTVEVPMGDSEREAEPWAVCGRSAPSLHAASDEMQLPQTSVESEPLPQNSARPSRPSPRCESDHLSVCCDSALLQPPMGRTPSALMHSPFYQAFLSEPRLYAYTAALEREGIDTLDLVRELSLSELKELLPHAPIGDRIRMLKCFRAAKPVATPALEVTI